MGRSLTRIPFWSISVRNSMYAKNKIRARLPAKKMSSPLGGMGLEPKGSPEETSFKTPAMGMPETPIKMAQSHHWVNF